MYSFGSRGSEPAESDAISEKLCNVPREIKRPLSESEKPEFDLKDLEVWTAQELVANRWTNCNIQTLEQVCEKYPVIIRDLNTGQIGTYDWLIEMYANIRFLQQRGRGEFEIMLGVAGNRSYRKEFKAMLRSVYAGARKGAQDFIFKDHATFRAKDIEAFERLFPEVVAQLKGKVQATTTQEDQKIQRHYWRARAIAEFLWQEKGTEKLTVRQIAENSGLLAYGCENISYDVGTIEGWIRDLHPKASDALALKCEVPEKPVLKAPTRRRERCRAIAGLLWRRPENISLRVGLMSKRPEIVSIGCEGEEYTAERTIPDWIRDVNPGRRGQ